MKHIICIAILFSIMGCETQPISDTKILYPGDRYVAGGVEVSCAPDPLEPPVDPKDPDPVAKAPDLILLRGETSEIRLPPGECPSFAAAAGLTVEVLEPKPYEATHESYSGLPAGQYLDALPPCGSGHNGIWLDVTAARDAAPGIRRLGDLEVLVLEEEIAARPAMPFYATVNFDDVKRLWGADGDYLTKFGPQMLDWIRFVRAHRIEPMNQWPGLHAPENLAQFNEYGLDYRKFVVEGALGGPQLVRPNVPVSATTLQAIERQIQAGALPTDSWGYVWDEGQPGSLPELAARAALMKNNAPSLKRWATWEPLADVRPLLDGFWPVLDWFGAHVPPAEYSGLRFGLYTSCMGQGRCHDGPVANPSGTPLAVVGSPEIHQRMFPVVARALGAERIQYYTLTKHLVRAWQPGGQWNEGGEGDGTALYALDQKPVASVRLKAWRKGMNDLEYARILGYDLKQLVRSPRDWSKDHAPLDELRLALARKFGAVK
jgi:hypothetical protein